MPDDLLAQALSLRRLQLSIFPVPRPRPGVPSGQVGDGKVPAMSWRFATQQLANEVEVRRWFAEPANIAVVTGAVSGVVVIDAYNLDALHWCTRHLPYTRWQTQTARGFHLWYRHPGVCVPNRARIDTREGRLAIDVRGDGGYVIAPGSIHASGALYREAGDWRIAREDLPRFQPTWLQRPLVQRSAPRGSARPTGDLVSRARRYLDPIPRPEIGAGSDNATFSAACRLVCGFGLPAADAEALLWEWAGGRPGWTPEWISQKVQHALRYGSEPVGVYR
jgi:hypothetical protein